MDRSRSASDTSVGLFAFLDVLMSTMGSLILVLMVVTPKIRQEVVSRAAAKVAGEATKPTQPEDSSPARERPREVVDLGDKLRAQIAELALRERDKQHAVDEAAATLSAAEDRLQHKIAERSELQGRLTRLRRENEGIAASTEALTNESREIQGRLLNEGARLRRIRGQLATSSTRYNFIAYDGVSGTTRRPILLECTSKHIKFLQEDISLSSADVTGFTAFYNPLVAGSQALIDYWTLHASPGEPRPYVLILVRPTGTREYNIARRLLDHLQGSFGYELLTEDMALEVPPQIPEAAEACRKAVAKAIAERDGVFQHSFAIGRGHDHGGTVPDGSLVGDRLTGKSLADSKEPPSVFDDSPGGGSQGSTGVRKDAVNQGGQAESQSLLKPNMSGTADPSGWEAATGSSSSGTNPSNAISSGSVGDQSTVGSASHNGDGRSKLSGGVGEGLGGASSAFDASPPGGSAQFGSLPAMSGQPGFLPGGTGPSGTNHFGMGQAGTDQTGSGQAGSAQLGAGETSSGQRGTGQFGTGQLGTGQPVVGQFGTGQPGGSGQPGDQPGGMTPGPTQGTGNGEPATADLRQRTGAAGESELGQPGSGQSAPTQGMMQSQSGQSATGQFGTVQSEAAPLSVSQTGLPQFGNPGGTPSTQTEAAGSPQQGSAASSDGGVPDNGQRGSSDSGSSTPSDGSRAPLGTSADDLDNPRRTVRHQWGYAGRRATVGFERDVTIGVQADRIIVGQQPPVSCDRFQSSRELSAAVIAALDRDARSWGPPPENFYWVPHINFVISPGGNVPFERIRPAIALHGLISSVDYRLDAADPSQKLGLPLE